LGICKLCGLERELIRSHIIPLAFHRHLQSDPVLAPVIVSNDSAIHPRRSPGGIYDEQLLCGECEIHFGPWDQYAAECLLQRFERDAQSFDPVRELIAYKFDGWDEARLRMFFISLLWRAAATNNYFFNRVTLGPYEVHARRLILSGTPGSPDDFSVLLCRWTTRPEHKNMELAQMSPYRTKLEGINMVKLFLGGMIIYIKCDQRTMSEPFREIILYPGRPVYAIARQFEGSKDVIALRPALENLASRKRR
jgi:hypothetical protein